jgi:hypothetical protein
MSSLSYVVRAVVGRARHPVLAFACVVLAAGLAAAASTAAGAQVVPRRATGSAGTLYSVSCASKSQCMAVGQQNASKAGPGGPLAERLNGKTWKSVSTPKLSHGGSLRGVACTSAKSCIAVGGQGTTSPPLAERWNGSRWSVLKVPAPRGSTAVILDAVSCSGAKNCWAVGTSGVGSINTLTEHWNGSKWSLASSPNGHSGKPNELSGVACPSTGECWAVGIYFPGSLGGTLTERWNGSKWSIVKTPTSKSGQLLSVSCHGTRSCLAVGIGNSLFALAQHWNGSSWAATTPKRPSGATDSELNGTACPDTSACVAVGDAFNSKVTATLAERWNGSKWSVLSTPSPSGSSYSTLQSDSCSSATNCWAVGESFSSKGASIVIEHWNGSKWSIS